MTKLRTWRKAQKLTLRQLAERIGSTPAALSRYETGKRLPRPQTLQAIVKVTAGEVTANDLFTPVDIAS